MVVDAKKWRRVLTSLSHQQLEQIEEYRRTQTPIPDRAEAIRRLIAFGLKTVKPLKRK